MAIDKIQNNYIGFAPTTPAGRSTQALNAAATWVAFSFYAKDANLNEVRINVSSVTGTYTTSEFTGEIYSDSNGQPNTTIESQNAQSASTGFVAFTGYTSTLTVGTRYWMVFKNLNATPASNFPTIGYHPSNAYPTAVLGNNVVGGWAKRHTTNSGVSWAAGNVGGCCGLMLTYDAGSTPQYDGIAYDTGANITATDLVYSTRELGMKFTTPTVGKFRVSGLSFLVYRGGSPTQGVRFRIYEGTTLLDTTNVLQASSFSGGIALYATAFFNSPIELTPGVAHRVVISEPTQSDTSSNYYSSFRYTLFTNTGASSLLPFNGTVQETYYDGSSWTDTSGRLMPFIIHLDQEQEITGNSGGGGAYSMGYFG